MSLTRAPISPKSMTIGPMISATAARPVSVGAVRRSEMYRLEWTFKNLTVGFNRPVTRSFARWYLIEREGYRAMEL